jgi:hypothetical protein
LQDCRRAGRHTIRGIAQHHARQPAHRSWTRRKPYSVDLLDEVEMNLKRVEKRVIQNHKVPFD